MFTSPPFWRTAGGAGDPWWSYVVTMLHFDGDYVDYSPAANSYTIQNAAALASSPLLYGTGVLDCTSDPSDGVVASSTSLAMGSGDFCIETWFYDPSSAGNQIMWQLIGSGGSTGNIRLYTPTFSGDLTVDTGGAVSPSGSVLYSYNTWHHTAVTRNGSNWTHWFDGVAAQTWTDGSVNYGTGIATFRLGRASSPGSGMQMYFDETRLTRGVPRYTAPFTPSGPYPNF